VQAIISTLSSVSIAVMGQVGSFLSNSPSLLGILFGLYLFRRAMQKPRVIQKPRRNSWSRK
jgi:hypothetical protein